MEKKRIIAQLKQNLSELTAKCISTDLYGDNNWTQHVKKCLGELGKSNGYKICAATEEKEYEQEWLYDLVWYKENVEGFLIDIPLVVECEWKKNLIKDIKFDFEKLLLSKSLLKLMICNGNEIQENAFLDYFKKAINICPLVGLNEVYLIAVLTLESIDAVDIKFFEIEKQQ